MKLLLNFFVLLLLASCSNINFLVDAGSDQGHLENKTAIYVSGWENPILKELLFLKLGEVRDKQFLLTVEVKEKKIKRSVSENQVAQKIDHEIVVNYVLNDLTNSCPKIEINKISRFSFTPKSSGYNFASDVLLEDLYEKNISVNVNDFLSIANSRLTSLKCIDEN